MQPLFNILIICVLAIIGGVLYRWRGGGKKKTWNKFFPRPIDQILFSSVYIFIAFYFLDAWPAAVLSAVTVIMVLKGHGRHMDLGTGSVALDPLGQAPEWYEPLIKPLYGKITEYWYDATGLMVSGLSYTFALGLFLAHVQGFHWGIFLALSGALKAPAYMLGRYLTDRNPKTYDLSEYDLFEYLRLKNATEWGEFFTGCFLWACAALYICAMMNHTVSY